MKKALIILLVLFSLCATDAVAETLYTLKSEHFEFIYPAESEDTAVILYENAENLYEKATSLLNTDMNLWDTRALTSYSTRTAFLQKKVFQTSQRDSLRLI